MAVSVMFEEIQFSGLALLLGQWGNPDYYMPLRGCGGRNDDSMGEAGFERNVEQSITHSRFRMPTQIFD
jgi:hypothetical protein